MRALLAIALVATPCLFAAPARAMTVDELVTRNIQAHGGADRMHAIQSTRMTSKARFGDGDFTVEMTFVGVTTRSGSERVEGTWQAITSVDAYDGHDGWRTDPFQGRRDPFRVSADEAKEMAHDVDLDGPLVDWREKGHRVEYLGTEDIDGTLAHKLRITRKDGDFEYDWLDPDTMLEIRVERHAFIRGAEQVTQSDLSDYEQVAGVWMPFASDSGAKGRPRTSHWRVERVEVNVPVDDALFHFPAPGVKVARSLFSGPPSPASTAGQSPPPPSVPPVFDGGVVSGLRARNIGSAAMSGRISAVTGHNVNGRTTLYVGAASGGVWKSLDGGTTFKPIFDQEPVQSIGAIAVDPSNWKNIWVGTGEAWTRNSASIGDGIYRSTDAGETWTNVGLPESERIARIVIHPHNGDVVYACVPGKLWSDSPDRGVYRTSDGGKTWSLVLSRSADAGGNLRPTTTIDPDPPKFPPPFGAFAARSATPVLTGTLPLAGWALSSQGIAGVDMWREPNPREPTPQNGLIYIGPAIWGQDARPDVEKIYPNYPGSRTAGWSYLLHARDLPSLSALSGTIRYRIHAIAHDKAGNSADLGVKTIIVRNQR